MRFAQILLYPAAIALLVLSGSLHAQDSRAEKLRGGLHDIELIGKWIYDDIEAGFTQAKRTESPS